METKNAIIKKTMLGVEDHGFLTCFLYLDFGGAQQGFGGHSLHDYGLEYIEEILKALEIDDWEKLPGTPVRIVGDRTEIFKIGHFIKDQWFEPRKWYGKNRTSQTKT